jgi:Coenzyme PQQ synthesis protein D (PqqD)
MSETTATFKLRALTLRRLDGTAVMMSRADVAGAVGDSVFHLSPTVVMEGFDDGALALRLTDRHLFELNHTAHCLLELGDGQHTATQVAAAPQDTRSLYGALPQQGVIELIESKPDCKGNQTVEGAPIEPSQYTRNPDVVLREEDEDGGLLFNPDTGQVKVVNTTGLFSRKECDGSRSVAEIARRLQDSFEDAPADQVAPDVREFVDGMVETGFVGVVASVESTTKTRRKYIECFVPLLCCVLVS